MVFRMEDDGNHQMEYQLVTPRDSMGFDLEAYVSFHMSVYQLTALEVTNHKTIMVSIKEDPWD